MSRQLSAAPARSERFGLPPEKAYYAADSEAERAIAILQPLPMSKKCPRFATAGFCYRVTGESLGAESGDAWFHKALDALIEGRRADEASDRAMARRNRLVGKTVGPSHSILLYLELSRVYRDLGQYREALDAAEVGRSVEPQAEIFEEMAKTYQAMGDSPQAATSLLEGITMGSTEQVRLAAEVVELYRQTAPGSCALAGSGASAAIDFNCPLVHDQLCLAGRNVAVLYHRMHREKDAAATVASAVGSLECPAEMFR